MSFLEKLQLFFDLSDDEKNTLALFTQEKLLRKGENLFNEGEEGVAMYFLLSGTIEISRNVKSKKVILGKVEAEDVLGEMALFGDSKKRMANAIALEDCELVTILSFSIKQLTAKYPKLLEKIKNTIEARKVNNQKLIDNIN